MVVQAATGLRRGLAILFALERAEGDEGGLGVVRIAELVGQEKSQVSRTLRTLAELGLVDRDPTTLAYRLGWRLYTLAARAGERRLRDAAPAALARLVRELGETAHLSVLEGTEVLTVQSEAPARAVQAAGWVGRTVPVYCTSSGRALLFDHDRDELEALLAGVELRPLAANTPRSIEELACRIRAARPRGVAVVDEESEAGLLAVAAPIRDLHGSIVAAVNVSGPKFRFGKRLGAARQEVASAATQLSGVLGYPRAEAASGRLPRELVTT